MTYFCHCLDGRDRGLSCWGQWHVQSHSQHQEMAVCIPLPTLEEKKPMTATTKITTTNLKKNTCIRIPPIQWSSKCAQTQHHWSKAPVPYLAQCNCKQLTLSREFCASFLVLMQTVHIYCSMHLNTNDGELCMFLKQCCKRYVILTEYWGGK